MQDLTHCTDCSLDFNWRDKIVEREFDYVPGIGEIYETVILCPECNETVHFIAFTSKSIMKRREKLKDLLDSYQKLHEERMLVDAQKKLEKFQKEMIDFKKKFDAFNSEMSSRFNRELPMVEDRWTGAREKLSRQNLL